METGEQRTSQNKSYKSCAVAGSFVLGMVVATIGLLSVQHTFPKFFFAPPVPTRQFVSGATGTSAMGMMTSNLRDFYDPRTSPVNMQVGGPATVPARTGRYGGGPADPAVRERGVLVQGGSLKTWSYRSPSVEQAQVILSSEGRPIDADIELWNGPDNTPCKMRVYVQNGEFHPFSAVLETPRGPNTVAIRNIAQLEFPLAAKVVADNVDHPNQEALASGMVLQGGAMRTYPFHPEVESVQVFLKTDGRPLSARIELLQGPNNNEQVIELYMEDGMDRPFFCILATPGPGNVVRIVNTAPVEFPMTASVVPNSINTNPVNVAGPVLGGDGRDVVVGGGAGW
jgi:hypothetical protein